MLPYRPTGNLRIDDFRVRMEDRPGWVRGSSRLPDEGEEVFCAAGTGTVKALHGKTGDGSRLVQIELTDGGRKPFYAAASNVLLPPRAPRAAAEGAGVTSEGSLTAPWLGGSGSAPCLE